MLEKAIEIAVAAHKGQKDKGGMPYILHPLHVMTKMDDELERTVAVLHDVLEDSDVTVEDLLEAGISPLAVHAVTLLTHRNNVAYKEYIRRIGEHPLARKVKMADLKHNMDLSRLLAVTPRDLERVVEYKKAYDYFKTI